MNSNIPNSPDERSPNNGGEELRNGEYNERNNPYFARQQAGAEPDLDANEPVLRSSDIKRLNRKALVFLAAIAALLILVIFWLATQSGEDSPPPKQRTETVVAPALPQNMTAPVDEAPVPLAQQPSLPPLPPMPTDDSEEGSSAPERQRGPTLLERRILAESAANGAGMPGKRPLSPHLAKKKVLLRWLSRSATRMVCWYVAPTSVASWRPGSFPISVATPRAS